MLLLIFSPFSWLRCITSYTLDEDSFLFAKNLLHITMLPSPCFTAFWCVCCSYHANNPSFSKPHQFVREFVLPGLHAFVYLSALGDDCGCEILLQRWCIWSNLRYLRSLWICRFSQFECCLIIFLRTSGNSSMFEDIATCCMKSLIMTPHHQL